MNDGDLPEEAQPEESEASERESLWPDARDFFRDLLKDNILTIAGTAILAVLGAQFFPKMLSTFLDSSNDKVTVTARLSGNVSPGETVELFPPSVPQQVGKRGEITWPEQRFADLANRVLELRVVRGFDRKTIVSIPVPGHPVIHIESELQ